MRKLKLLSMIAAFATAFTPDAYALDLSLDAAVEKIVAESHDLKKAEANLRQAEASLDAANANRWFTLDGTVAYSNRFDVTRPFNTDYKMEIPSEYSDLLGMSSIAMPDHTVTAGLSFTQPIYTFGKIGNAVKSVKSAIKMSQASREMTERAVRYSAVELYWAAKMTDEIVRLSEKDLKDARNARRNLTAAGRANRSNLVKIESDIASKEINLSDAEFNRDTAHRMLKILAGIDVNEELNLTDNFPTAFADLAAPATLESTPQWDILSEQVNVYERSARAQRAGGLPTLAAVGSYDFYTMHANANRLFDHSGVQQATLGVALQVPIFSGGLHRANATVDAMKAEAARQDLEQSKKIVSEEYERAIAQYDHLRGNLKNLENARDLAAKAYTFSQQRFAAGQTSAIELAEVSSGLYQLDMALLNAKYNILMSAESVKKLGE